MNDISIIDMLLNQGFAIAVCVWLLYQKAKEGNKVLLTLDRICNTMYNMNTMIEEMERKWHYK
jgi:hypothetical protein